MELVAGGEDRLLIFRERVFHHGIVFIRGEDEAESGIIIRCAAFPVVVIDVELQLADVFVGKLAYFEIDEDVALEDGVVEDEIDVEVIALKCETLLSGDEGKAVS